MSAEFAEAFNSLALIRVVEFSSVFSVSKHVPVLDTNSSGTPSSAAATVLHSSLMQRQTTNNKQIITSFGKELGWPCLQRCLGSG